MGVGTGLYMFDVFSTGDSSGSELCAPILKSLAKAAWCLWRVSTVFARSAITPPEGKRFGWKLWHTRSILLIAAGPGMGRIAITCRITLNHLSTAAMRLMSNYFHHLLFLGTHTDSRTDSQALWAEYCIVFIQHNTAILLASGITCHLLSLISVQYRVSSVISNLLIFSGRELTFTFAICYRPSVCRLSVSVVCLSVTLVHPSQPVEIFGNFFHHTIAQGL